MMGLPEVHDNKLVRYKKIFDKYDIQPKDGYINVNELQRIIKEHDNYNDDIPPEAAHRIMDISDKDGNEIIDFEEFVEMIENPKLSYLFGKYLDSYVNFITYIKERNVRKTKEYHSCCPPPIVILLVSIVQVICFCLYEYKGDKTVYKALRFSPKKKYQIWRFVTYMFVHTDYLHLLSNLFVQLVLGLPLEMVHKWRVLPVYIAGVLAGSLVCSAAYSVGLIGSSAGVCALLTAHIASIVMNWSEVRRPVLKLIIFITILLLIFAHPIYLQYWENYDVGMSLVAHFAGIVVGLIVGIHMLKNLRKQKFEKYLWYGAAAFSTIALASLIILNIIK